jgi:tripartite-type tricarboxylate transporter receptor subunit TctC
MSALLRSVLVSVGVLAVQSLAAEPFPAKPVRIVVPYPISGPTDVRGTSRMSRSYRMMASASVPAISDTLARTAELAIRADSAHPVVLERQPGGATTRGAVSVARGPADGHTLLLGSNGTMVINPHFFHGVEYVPARDFVLVAPLATMPFALMVAASVPADNMRELVKWLSVRPGEVNYGSSGDGSTGHLAGELFRRMTAVHVVHVPFNSGVTALAGLATRQVSVAFTALPATLIYHPSEHFRPIAVTSARRSERLPDLPTLAESGLPGYEIEGWYGLFARVGSPPAANAWIRERIAAALAEPATRAELIALGLDPARMSLEQFATRINTEQEKWAPVLRASRLALKRGA